MALAGKLAVVQRFQSRHLLRLLRSEVQASGDRFHVSIHRADAPPSKGSGERALRQKMGWFRHSGAGGMMYLRPKSTVLHHRYQTISGRQEYRRVTEHLHLPWTEQVPCAFRRVVSRSTHHIPADDSMTHGPQHPRSKQPHQHQCPPTGDASTVNVSIVHCETQPYGTLAVPLYPETPYRPHRRRAGPQGDRALLAPEERREMNDYETKMQAAERVGRKARHQKTRSANVPVMQDAAARLRTVGRLACLHTHVFMTAILLCIASWFSTTSCPAPCGARCL